MSHVFFWFFFVFSCLHVVVGPKKVTRIIGSIRIRSKTQGIALSLGDRIGLLQRKQVKKED